MYLRLLYLVVEDILIRKAIKADALGIATVHVLGWQKAYEGLMPAAFLEAMSIADKVDIWEKRIETLPENTHYVVAEKDETIIGFSTFGKSRDSDADEKTGELVAIYVHPEYLGMGAGYRIINEVVKSLKNEGYTKATLWVLEENHKTRAWYEKQGWKVEGGKKTDQRKGFVLNEIRYEINWRK